MKRLGWLVSMGLCTLAMASAASTTVSIGGQSVALNSVVVGGKTYVSLDQLKSALTAAGGSNQLASAEGCMNQWLFDGVWRLRVTKVEFKPNSKDGTFWGWIVTTEMRNGVQDVLSLYHTGIGPGLSVALKDGTTVGMGRNSASPPPAFADNSFKNLPSGAGIIMPLWFYAPSGATDDDVKANPPTKLLVPVDLKEQTYHGLKLPFTRSPNFRVDLTCSK